VWSEFRSFGPVATARFDHHIPPPKTQDRAILYAAFGWVTCLAEVFQAQRVIDPFNRDPWLVGFRVERPLCLLDLSGMWPTRVGASMAISAGPRQRAQRWARAIYDAFADVEGILYASSMHANRPAVALNDRAMDALAPRPTFHSSLSSPALTQPLKLAGERLGYTLVRQTI
jgi:hypothetical protein